MTDRRVLVIGGGIAGLAAAVRLSDAEGVAVELWEADARLGGKIATSPFGGLPAVDEGADAYLTRVPHAVALARKVGLAGDAVTAPTDATAMVWHDGLHSIPGGIVLGVPASVRPFVTTDLLSWKGKLRAAIEPFLPATDPDDSLGALVRARFGDEVHDRLVDALVGSIYATDTDRFSLEAVPQLSMLAGRSRSLLLGARSARAGAGGKSTGPIFNAPCDGVGALVSAAARFVTERGAVVRTGRAAEVIERDGSHWRVDGEPYDAVIVASPAHRSARLLSTAAPGVSSELATFEQADVVMVRLAVPREQLPGDVVSGRSGYLVAKSRQRRVTAVSFGSQKWAHWRPADGTQILRVSLGRDGLPVADLDDAAVLDAVYTELGRHLASTIRPTEVSITRWIGAFPQYRPHHGERVAGIERSLPAGLHLAGASYRGIGIPACIADGERAADQAIEATRR